MTWRVRSRGVFRQLRTQGIRVRSGPVRLSYVSLSSPHPQLAFAIGRRFGNAVARNRARRRLRAAFDAAWTATPSAPTGAYLLMADPVVLTAPFEGLEQSIRSCLGKVEAKLENRTENRAENKAQPSLSRTGARP